MIEFDLNLDDLLRYSDPFVQNTIKTELSGMLRVFAALVLLLVLWRLFQGIKGNLEIRRLEKAGYAAEKACRMNKNPPAFRVDFSLKCFCLFTVWRFAADCESYWFFARLFRVRVFSGSGAHGLSLREIAAGALPI